ncbi:hypothetical protein PCANC_10952 [Puccinia coronata f. sp. avenae]|uniref:Uncharacterized protein n=1 Tax=Puccinia coronata f. sp. avenae TaxID=200324 RepID=A0A2N5UWL5_9BASI|nr:hypothetical protein PCANC_10952 [Puccinia coronata f. sp. avenae]PLW49464.1 hypothetical protein PCASD_01984 [Puccinia coronata f. sp. avenae]
MKINGITIITVFFSVMMTSLAERYTIIGDTSWKQGAFEPSGMYIWSKSKALQSDHKPENALTLQAGTSHTLTVYHDNPKPGHQGPTRNIIYIVNNGPNPVGYHILDEQNNRCLHRVIYCKDVHQLESALESPAAKVWVRDLTSAELEEQVQRATNLIKEAHA